MRLGLFASAYSPFPHPGHLHSMQQALDADRCDAILAALHVDPSRENQAKRRPALTMDERRQLLHAIKWVEAVIPYHTEDDLLAIIREHRPACLIVGLDHLEHAVTGADLAPVFWARRRPDWSGTIFTDRIYDAERIRREQSQGQGPPSPGDSQITGRVSP